ncbi:regulatory protein RecX [Pontibacter sp. BT731]|uniref:regulatory protein RecX n=1 Tax=Pontibacter coccineus TaxID=3063328 RepID=UPI0026E18D26|nr:regulatory protein RecX [Pontibacter sp. BT731]MDO6392366.1 regulatory protein RecX [Pontibacter sp. BT731]
MERQKKQKTYTPKEALIKAAAYCAYQERTQQEVRTKLYTYGLEPDDVEEIIVRLGQEKMLDEERYAQAYVRGKYGLKKWGRRKIVQGLKAKGISEYCIKQGLKEIDYDVYEQNLQQLLEKKNATEKEKNPFARRQKLSYYLMSKGYESDLVQDAIKKLEG